MGKRLVHNCDFNCESTTINIVSKTCGVILVFNTIFNCFLAPSITIVGTIPSQPPPISVVPVLVHYCSGIVGTIQCHCKLIVLRITV